MSFKILFRPQFVRFNCTSSKIIAKDVTKYGITLQIQQGTDIKRHYLDHFLLRDASQSPTSVDTVSGQKLFTMGSLLNHPSGPIRPQLADIVHDGAALEVHWSDGDQFTYTSKYLESLYDDSVSIKKFEPEIWNKDAPLSLSKISVDFHSYMDPHDETHLYETMKVLDRYGIALITNIPNEAITNYTDWYVQMICERIGHVRTTFYGELFDVKNLETQANNIAYTSKPLPLHMDLLYLENVPGWQLLHCIKNSKGSGQNYFADTLAALQHIKSVDDSVLKALEQIPLSYHYKRDDKRYYQRRPLVEHKKHETVINYSPPFQGPVNLTEVDLSSSSEKQTLEKFKKGLAMFENYINDPQNQFQIMLPENSCVIFHNRRVLHARKAFEGERWLKGCYLDADTFSSRLTALYEKFGDE